MNTAISSTDPDAVKRLKDKLAGLQRMQEAMKQINNGWRKCGKPDPDDDTGWMKVAGTVGVDYSSLHELRVGMKRHWRDDAPPYETYQLSNNNQNMNAIKKRIKQLSAMTEREEINDKFDNGIEVREEDDRLCIFFGYKPDAEVREFIKRKGFKWAPSRTAWVRKLTPNALSVYQYSVKEYLQEL